MPWSTAAEPARIAAVGPRARTVRVAFLRTRGILETWGRRAHAPLAGPRLPVRRPVIEDSGMCSTPPPAASALAAACAALALAATGPTASAQTFSGLGNIPGGSDSNGL